MGQYRYLTYSLVLTVLGFGIWIAFKDQQKIVDALSHVGLLGFLFVCSLSCINYIIRYFRWRYLLQTLKDETPFWDGLLCYFSGFALTTTPGKAGEVIRCFYLNKRHGVKHTHTLASLLSERASDAIAGALLALLAFYSFKDYRVIGFALLVFITLIIFLINKPKLLLAVSTWFRFIKINFIQKIMDGIPLFIEKSSMLFSVKTLGFGTFLGFFSWSAEAYGFAWLAQSLGGSAPITLYMSIFAIGMIAGAISFLPGGLGGTELVLYLLLKATGLGDVEALTITLVCRLATLWFAVVLGLLSVVLLGRYPVTPSAEGG